MDNKPLWKVFTENAFTRGQADLAVPELARQIEDRIHAEGRHADIKVVAIAADDHFVTVRCDDDFGLRLNDLPGASYAEKSKPAKAPTR